MDERLRKRAAVQAVFAKGERFSDRRLVLLVLAGETGRRRCAFAAGKKLGNAVQRNRVRRRMREAYRMVRGEFLVGCDLVLLARPDALEGTFEELTTALQRVLQKAEAARRPASPSPS
ncbi:MAG: ribonuclease P protein component [Thermaerobacter sp.]|nr:ribonuclease P protein component [Thermaerobacter sp.]